MGFLETVYEQKRAEVAARASHRPVAGLEADAARVDARDFRAAISQPGSIIAELKARTPTVASFRHSHALHDLAGVYAASGASAISIVTDERRFGTSLDDVRRVRDAVALPVLVKDFVIDRYQMVEARAAGADAILLIVRMLDDDTLASLLAAATGLGLAALVETHDEHELERALAAGAAIVGINNRDLDTMSVSLDTTRRLAPRVDGRAVVVAESGIRTRADVEDLAAHGARAFLVGTTLLDAPDPGAVLEALAGRR